MTDRKSEQLEFQGFGRRRVVAAFSGGHLTSDGGLTLLREIEHRSRVIARFARCFTDCRVQSLIEHTSDELIAQRVYGIACGYEDLNDHDTIRDDALFAVAVGKQDVTGAHRKRERDRGHALAGKSTLNRLELTSSHVGPGERYKKITFDAAQIDALFVEVFLDAHKRPPKAIVLDLDATHDPVHGHQEGRFFHGFYGCYCYLPLYITCGDFLLCARLRPSNIDESLEAEVELERIVSQIRERWPHVRIAIRADSAFARERIMSWCEENHVDYVLGLARNSRLEAEVAGELEEAKRAYEETQEPTRLFKDFRYRTLKTWSCTRRVVAKAEHLPGKANPRFIVTSVPINEIGAKALYEDVYCARGDMENRIKEQQLGLFADRTSSATLRANQLRLYFSSIAYVLINEFRRVGLKGTKLERAQAWTIRVRVLKIAAIITLSVRRIHVALSSVYPLQDVFARALANIRGAPPIPA